MTTLGNHRARILVGDAQDRLQDLEDDSVHTVVTSPPYWGLRDYHVDGQIGLEDELDGHIESLVEVFREVRRVLRPDGTLWLNYGDRSAGDNGDPTTGEVTGSNHQPDQAPSIDELHPRSRVGMPWRVAFALMDDGWILREEIIWEKRNPMPESVTNRPTRAHDQVFLFAPDYPYFYDAHAIREPASKKTSPRHGSDESPKAQEATEDVRANPSFHENTSDVLATRNKRSVWSTVSQPYSEAHFATFPPSLPRPCIRAGTSEKGCCAACGTPLERQTTDPAGGQTGESWHDHDEDLRTGNTKAVGQQAWNDYEPPSTEGWRRTCDCDTDDTKPCTVLDPFLGAGTTALVALEEGRRAIGVDLNPEYAEMAWERVQDLAEMRRLEAF